MDEPKKKTKVVVTLLKVIVFLAIVFCSFLCFLFLRSNPSFLMKGSFFGKQEEQGETVKAQEAELADRSTGENSDGDQENGEEIQPDEHTAKEPEEYATSHKDDEGKDEDPEPLTESPVTLSDLYTEQGSVAALKCYYPDAMDYTWEVRDMESGQWIPVPEEDVALGTDELFRQVSTYLVEADGKNKEFDVRCKTRRKGGELTVDTATVHLLDKIESVSVEEYTARAGEYVSARDIPVKICFQDGSQDTVAGLNGLFFVEKEETSESPDKPDAFAADNLTEVITTIITVKDYCYLDREKTALLRYQVDGEPVDLPIRMTGKDETAPQITKLTVSDFEISTIDQPVPVKISITAEDDVTRYSDLEYAFLPEGEEPEEKDWLAEAVFQVDITRNGTWIAYCKDESGNIAAKEQELVVVDNKPPVIRLSLENNDWCTENKIIVEAKDAQPVEYCFICMETGQDSGWIKRNEYVVKENGTWNVKVKDAVGNETEQEITVDKIDKQAPVIRAIREKTEGEAMIDD